MKKLVLGVVGFLVLVLLGGGGWFGYRKFVAGRGAKTVPVAGEKAPEGEGAASEAEKGDEEGDEDEAPHGGEGEEGKAAGPSILIYKNNVNLEGRKNAYLVVELHILFRDAELGKLATSDKATVENSTIRSILLEILSGKTLEEAADMETREGIRLEIKDRLNEKFKPKPPASGEKTDKAKKRPKHPVKEVLIVSWAIAQ